MTPAIELDQRIARQQAFQAHHLAIACAGLHLLVCGVLALTTETLLLCLLVGVPSAAIPAMIALRYPTSLLSRLAMAIGFMGFTALAIQQSGGEIEAHFSFFVMMSVLVVYHDWRPLALAASLIVVHHVVFTLLQPVTPSLVIWQNGGNAWTHILIHLVAVLGQTAVLCYIAGILSQRFRLERENTALARSLHDATDEASRDSLTGLYNRRHLGKLTRRLQPLVDAGRETVVLLSLDIDHFKRVNDRYGHPVGDEVLRTIGRTIEMSVGRDACAVRCGGEEFLVLLRDRSLEQATALGEALRGYIAGAPAATTAGAIRLTISVGIASWGEREPFQSVYRKADEALYAAKEAGRNRVVVMDACGRGKRSVRQAA